MPFDSHICRAVLLAVLVLWMQPGGAASGQDRAKPTFADSLISVDGDSDLWVRRSLVALAAELGIEEQAFSNSWPGLKLDMLPANVTGALQKGADGIDDWLQCLRDQRPTRIVSTDPFTGRPAKNGEKLTCANAARIVLARLIPSNRFEKRPQDDVESIGALIPVAEAWRKQLQGVAPQERLEKWFAEAGEHQRRMLLVVALQTRFDRAFPLLEQDFLSRANKQDDFLYLDVSAYVRQRRSATVEFVGRLNTKWRERPPEDEHRAFFTQLWATLGEYDSLAPAVQDWRDGRISAEKLAALLERSIDQPWAYHSVAIEPIFMHGPVVEANLKTLVAAARQEEQLEKRMILLTMGVYESQRLIEVIHRTNAAERLPRLRSDSPAVRTMVEDLRSLLNDDRLASDDSSLAECPIATPGSKAAQIVWYLWGPNTSEIDVIFNGESRDWRGDKIDLYGSTCRTLLVPAALDFLQHPGPEPAQSFPTAEAAAVLQQFVAGSAADWRRQLEALRWDQRLMFQLQARNDAEFAARLAPRMLEFVDAHSAGLEALPASFERLWKDSLVGQKLDEPSWAALRNWVAAEARSNRWWCVYAEAVPCRPGISLYVSPAHLRQRQSEAFPTVQATATALDFLPLEVEKFRIEADRLERVPIKDNPFKESLAEPRAWPTPIEAIKADKSALDSEKEFNLTGYTINLFALPAKK
jgi:hypothetical protein